MPFLPKLLLATSALVLPPAVYAQAIDEYSGQETYFRFCASCHGEEARGDGPVAAGIPITVPDLTQLRRRRGDDFPQEILRKIIDGRNAVIYHGTRYMPVWGYEFWLDEGADEEAEARVEIIVYNLIEYLRSIQE
jgi:mono/diheme cytochrome c family protein